MIRIASGSYFAVANPRSRFPVLLVHPNSTKASVSLFRVTNYGNLATEFLVTPLAPRAIQQSCLNPETSRSILQICYKHPKC